MMPKFKALSALDWAAMDWRKELKQNVTTSKSLSDYLPLTEKQVQIIDKIVQIHPMNISRYYLSLIDPSDEKDPIRRQCVPDAEELVVAGQVGRTTADPYGDDKHDKGNGVLHKYDYTALVVTSEYCAMYCRHCFRKRMVGLPNEQTVKNFENAAKYIAQHDEITNAIFSGGDPLMLPNHVLRKMLAAIVDIPHLNHIRIGSRVPVTYPLRLYDNELIDMLGEVNRKKTIFLPTHFNHAHEITETSKNALLRIRMAGITVNNQAVLLRGVNDDSNVLSELMNGLLQIGVNPYYLYQCMPVARVRNHFQVPLKRAIEVVEKASESFDGYAKRFKFIIGHDIGKIEICGRFGDQVVLKQLHSRAGKGTAINRIFMRPLNDTGGWLDENLEIE